MAATLMKLLFSKWAMIALIILFLFVFGGSAIVFANPIILAFLLFVAAFMIMGGKK